MVHDHHQHSISAAKATVKALTISTSHNTSRQHVAMQRPATQDDDDNNNNSSSSNMSSDLNDLKGYINCLLAGFRPLIVNFQEEHKEYRTKLRDINNNNNNRDHHLRSRTTTISSGSHSSRKVSSSTDSSTLVAATTTIRSSSSPGTRLSSLAARNTNMSSVAQGGAVVARGALIVLEGLDRVGKSTLASKLVDHLKRTKRPVSHYRFPDRTTVFGQKIDEYLRGKLELGDDHVVHMLFSLNRWELSKKIRQTIKQGTTVIVDRYSYSGIAYSSAKRDLTMDWCIQSERGLPKPDLVIYLELPKEVQYRREGFGDERFETKELQENIRTRYEHLMAISHEDWIRINVDHKSPDQVLAEVIIPVKRYIENCANKELGVLNFHAP